MFGSQPLSDMFLDLFPHVLTGVFYLLPIVLGVATWNLYLYYIRFNWVKKLDRILLEIKLPKEVAKSPLGIEVMLSGMHQPGDGNMVDKYIKGRLRSWYTLEIASIGGNVHFYINTEKKFRELIESHIYSQYPEVVVEQVEDYVHNVPYGAPNSDEDLFGCHFVLNKADPYPIKTYIDFGLDKEKKDQFLHTDPLSSIIELIGSIKPHEQFWIQILIMAAKDRKPKPGGKWGEKISWKKEGEAIIEELSSKKTETGFPKFLTKDADKAVEAIGLSISKLGFDAGIRAVYLAPSSKSNGAIKAALPSIFKQFGSETLNSFKPQGITGFDYPWEDFMGIRLSALKADLFNAYRLRSHFWLPYPGSTFVLNTEEIATLFHFVGSQASSPSIDRIMTKRAEPPVDLPI